MTFDEFKPDDQALLQNRDLIHRRAILAIRKAVALAEVAILDDKITSSLLDQLDDGAAIPSTSGLSGIVPITKEANKINVGAMTDLVGLWNTEQMRELHAQYVGAENVDGSHG